MLGSFTTLPKRLNRHDHNTDFGFLIPRALAKISLIRIMNPEAMNKDVLLKPRNLPDRVWLQTAQEVFFDEIDDLGTEEKMNFFGLYKSIVALVYKAICRPLTATRNG